MPSIVDDNELRIESLRLGPWETNAYIVVCVSTGDSLVVDAPADADRIVAALEGTHPRYILLTHDHMDHIGALSELRSGLKVPLAAHPADSARLGRPPEISLKDGDELSLGGLTIRVLHTPGHTPGSVCFLVRDHLLAGDTLFADGPGKSWSPGAFREIVESITSKIFVLPDATRIHPGHGGSTVLKTEKDKYAVFASRPHDPDLCGDVVWLSS